MSDNCLYYGDNLDILRRYIKDESVDLIYLDPPFQSDATYNVLFSEKNGSKSPAQIKAFEDTWHWDAAAAKAYDEVLEGGGQTAEAMRAFRTLLGGNDMLAYLSMMAPRLVELRRVLKPTGSIYLHCDPTASHYLKVLMDAVFGPTNFRNDIVWKRQSAHSDSRGYGSVHDNLLLYVKSEAFTWNKIYQPYEDEYLEQYYRYKDEKGRRFMSGDLGAAGLQGGGYEYEWKGITRVWRVPLESMQRLDKEGRIFYTRNGIPRMKRYLDESKGMPAQDMWTDIGSLRSWHSERTGYPTQKPIALLERCIQASSNPSDTVLDPFCGCGTAVVAAQSTGRRWIGIDITYLAVALMKHRIRDMFGDSVEFRVMGEPTSLPDAKALAGQDPYQFQFWALGLVGARPIEEKKGADKGIDGRLYFHDEAGRKTKQLIISVKSGHVSRPQLSELIGVVEREKAQIGVFITLDEPTQPMRAEAASTGFYDSPGWGQKYPRIQMLTIKELLQGAKIQYPPRTNVTFKEAPKAKAEGPQAKRFPGL